MGATECWGFTLVWMHQTDVKQISLGLCQQQKPKHSKMSCIQPASQLSKPGKPLQACDIRGGGNKTSLELLCTAWESEASQRHFHLYKHTLTHSAGELKTLHNEESGQRVPLLSPNPRHEHVSSRRNSVWKEIFYFFILHSRQKQRDVLWGLLW